MTLQSQISDNDKTVLSDRVLWDDGDISLTPDQLYWKILSGKEYLHDFITNIDDDVIRYNRYFLPLEEKTKLNELNVSWNIPRKYYEMNVKQHLLSLLESESVKKEFTDDEVIVRVKRIKDELKLYSNMKLNEFILVTMFIVDTFQEKNVIWGTGRGSSCCSYILYLLGLHDVDSVKYGLNIKEFLR